MTEERRIAICTSYVELMDAIRARADELGVTRETLDAVSGLQAGYSSKLLAPVPIRSLGPTSLGPMLGALGLAIVVVEDHAMLAKVQGRLAKRQRPVLDASDGMLPLKRKKRRGYWRKNEAWSSILNSRRMLILPASKRSAIARKAARTRWAKRKVKKAAQASIAPIVDITSGR